MPILEMSPADVAWILTSSALVLLMTPGLAFFYGGLVQGSNVLNTMMMSIISMGVTAVLWLLVGFSLAFGSGGGAFVGDFGYTGLSGLESMLWPGTKLPAMLFAIFQMTFAIIASAIISGAVAERMRFSAWVCFICLWTVLVYAPVCHWAWGPGGWIDEIGAKDFAGGIVVHESTAVSALVLAGLLGPRSGHGEVEKQAQPHNVPFAILGAALLWFGWSGFNGGSALAADDTAVLALMNTYQAAASSLVVWALLARLQHKHASSASGMVTGAIVGLVIITPAAGFVSPVGAVAMGAIGTVLVYPTFQLQLRVDDNLDAFPCHGIGSLVGGCLTGLFAREGGLLYGGGWRLLGAQVLAAAATAVYTAAVTAMIFFVLSRFMVMRVTEDDESAGLDSVCHGEAAYGEQAGTPAIGSSTECGGGALHESVSLKTNSYTHVADDFADLEAQVKSVQAAVSHRRSAPELEFSKGSEPLRRHSSRV